MMDKLVKFTVGRALWLVPQREVTADFVSAVFRLNNTADGFVVEWSAAEEKEFLRILQHAATWRPL